MANIDVDALLATYEAEIGKLTGAVLRERALKAAELLEVRTELAALTTELEAVKRRLEAAETPADQPQAAVDAPDISSLPPQVDKTKARRSA